MNFKTKNNTINTDKIKNYHPIKSKILSIKNDRPNNNINIDLKIKKKDLYENNLKKNKTIDQMINIDDERLKFIFTKKDKQSPINEDKGRNRYGSRINFDSKYNCIDYLKERRMQYQPKIKIFKPREEKSLEFLRFQSKINEEKAKNLMELMRVRKNKKYEDEVNIKLSNILIDSISTKLAILDKIANSQSHKI